MKEQVIEVIRNEDGSISNIINYSLLAKYYDPKNSWSHPDIYLTFIIKTIVDDFGDSLVKGMKVNKEQFEAFFIKNLQEMLSQKTRKNED